MSFCAFCARFVPVFSEHFQRLEDLSATAWVVRLRSAFAVACSYETMHSIHVQSNMEQFHT